MPARSGNTLVKVLVWVGLLAAIPAVGFYYYQRNSAPKPPEYVTTTIARGSVVQTVTATGQLDPLITVDVSSQISGLVKELYVDFNTQVKAGQKLAEIDPATYEQRLRQAEAEFKSTQASNKLARLNAERTQELHDKNLVTQQEYDQVMAQLAQSDAQLLTRQAAVENAKTDLARCTLFSPIDGVVISKQTEIGKTVAASLNAPTLFVIANDLAKMQITAAVAEADIGAVQEGQEVTFTVDAFPGRTFSGRISQVRNAPKNTQNVVTYDTIIDVDNRDLELRPGMTANASIVVARRDNTLRIPNSALRVRMPDTIPVRPPDAPKAEAKGGEPPQQVASASPARDEPKASGAGERRSRGEGAGPGPGGGRRGGGGMFGANLTEEQRTKFREIMTNLGIDFRAGPPTTEQRAKLVEALTAAGLPVPENLQGNRNRAGAVTTRTVYRLPGGNKAATPEAVTIRTGISDGSASELVSGLNEGDVIITSVYVPGATVAAAGPQQQSNPFGAQRGGFGGRRP